MFYYGFSLKRFDEKQLVGQTYCRQNVAFRRSPLKFTIHGLLTPTTKFIFAEICPAMHKLLVIEHIKFD